MNIPRYWARIEHDLIIDGERTPYLSSFLGHSSVSMEEALLVAQQRVSAVQERIDKRSSHHAASYEVCIREEIVAELSSDAVVTRNRYGAEVLNCARLVIIDVDQPPAQGFWADLFMRDQRPPKERMLEHIRKAIRAMGPGPGYRIYETRNGFRVIVSGKRMAPADAEVTRLFKAMNCDPLYAMLCRRQDCYRARLTPKPYRIHQKPIRLLVPYDDGMRSTLAAWVPEYLERSRRFAVCKLVDVIGRDDEDEVIRYHDERCCRGRDLPLA
jgi:hypothetical protein